MDGKRSLARENAGKYCPDAWCHSKNRNSKFWKSKNILWYFSTSEIEFTLTFFHTVRTLRNKNYKDYFFGDGNQFVFKFSSPKLGQLETKLTENFTRSSNEKKSFNILFFIVNGGLTWVVLPNILAVEVTKEISIRKNFNGQNFSGRIDEGFLKNP